MLEHHPPRFQSFLESMSLLVGQKTTGEGELEKIHRTVLVGDHPQFSHTAPAIRPSLGRSLYDLDAKGVSWREVVFDMNTRRTFRPDVPPTLFVDRRRRPYREDLCER